MQTDPTTAAARAALTRESFALAVSLALVPLLCVAAGLVQGYDALAGAACLAAILLAYGGMASRACRRGRQAFGRGDLFALAHHSAYPLALIACLATYDDMIARPIALGLSLARAGGQIPG